MDLISGQNTIPTSYLCNLIYIIIYFSDLKSDRKRHNFDTSTTLQHAYNALELISVDGDKGTATVTINKSELKSDYESFLADDSDSIEIYYCPNCGKRLHKNNNLKLNSDAKCKHEKCPYCQGEHLPLLEIDDIDGNSESYNATTTITPSSELKTVLFEEYSNFDDEDDKIKIHYCPICGRHLN